LAAVVSCGIATIASAQTTRTVRVVCYNLQDDVNGLVSPTCGLIVPFTGSGGSFTTNCTGSVTNGGVLEGIGEEIIAGDPAQPIDVLAMEETTSNAQTIQPIVNGLNAFYAYYGNPAGYAMSPYQATQDGGNTTGNGPNAMVYNTNTLQLIASVGIATPTGAVPSGNGMYRQCVRYEFAPAGVTAGTNNEFYVYVSHYKADGGTNEVADRLGEARLIRNDEASNLPANARVLYVGDYNPDGTNTSSCSTCLDSNEPGYQTICSNSAPNGIKQGQGVDPLNILWGPYTDAATNIDWSSSTTNSQILFMLSEESYELRYRDDLQIMTSNVYYDVAGGLQYVQGSYHSFGNNGSFTWGNSVNTGGNTALNDLDPSLTNLYKLSAAVLLEDLTGASDHLPIVVDYTIPLPVTAPVASFTASPTNGVAPLIVAFTDTSTGSPTSWSWTFGDTGTSTLQNPSHTYTAPGTYTVRLIASNAGGPSTNTQVNLITVLPPPPVASFMASPTSGAVPLSVSFTDNSTGSITGWAWAFGDGNTSISQSPTDIYVNPGSYTVQEIVTGNGGSSTDTMVNLITVYDPFAWWQLAYFGTNNNANTAPNADYTGTGMSNTNKFLAGFNPTNSAAYLHVISIVEQSVAGNTNVVVTYLGANGDNTYTPGIASRTNVLDYTTGDAGGSYTSGAWQDTGQTNILGGGNGSGIVTNMTDTAIPGSSTNRYYRVRVLLP